MRHSVIFTLFGRTLIRSSKRGLTNPAWTSLTGMKRVLNLGSSVRTPASVTRPTGLPRNRLGSRGGPRHLAALGRKPARETKRSAPE